MRSFVFGFFALSLTLLAASEYDSSYVICPHQVGENYDFRVILQPEVFFLRPEQGLLEYAVTGEKDVALMQQSSFVPSFRCNLGFQTSYDYNDLLFSYTRYHSREKSSLKRPSDTLESIAWFLEDPSFVQALVASWRLKLDLLDVYLKKRISFGSLHLGGGFGMRGGFLRQTITITKTLAESASQQKSDNTSDSWYLGPKLAAYAEFLLTPHVYLSFEGAHHLVYTRYRLDHQETGASPTLVERKALVETINQPTEIAFGLGYAKIFSEEFHYDVSCKIYYFLFPGENRLLRVITPGSGKGDLSLLGVGLSARFDF